VNYYSADVILQCFLASGVTQSTRNIQDPENGVVAAYGELNTRKSLYFSRHTTITRPGMGICVSSFHKKLKEYNLDFLNLS
jgi:hypothetical protein